ncbi:hypothetical protein V8G54_009957 [Vigna mungo]|uniref:Uncharacterized protein n=1 Tax=Vigna mungo TaxID=3915 RepID=A0AAQ3NX46_VIGMU
MHMNLSTPHQVRHATTSPQNARESVNIRPLTNPQHSMVEVQSLIKEASFCIPTNQNIPREQIPFLHSPKNIPSIHQVPKPHKHTQKRVPQLKTQKGHGLGNIGINTRPFLPCSLPLTQSYQGNISIIFNGNSKLMH